MTHCFEIEEIKFRFRLIFHSLSKQLLFIMRLQNVGTVIFLQRHKPLNPSVYLTTFVKSS